MAFSDAEMLHALRADEARVEYSDRGEGEAILLIHAGVFGHGSPRSPLTRRSAASAGSG